MSGKSTKPQRRQNSAAGHDWSALDIRMLRDDISWIASLGSASQTDELWKGISGLALTPHMARIVHEGMNLLGRRRPAQAGAVKLKFGPQIEAARHTVKLLDDTQKLYDGVIQDFERIEKNHAQAWASGSNYALDMRDRRIFTTSRASQFQQSGQFAVAKSISKAYSNNLGYDIGQAVTLILRQFGYTPEFVELPVNQWGTPPKPTTVNRTTYYESRFEPEFPLALKDILCVIEGSVNSCLHVFKPVEGPFVGPVFRVLFVTVSHALNALDEVRGKYPHVTESAGMSGISGVLDSPEAIRIRSLRKLRNRCMHYLIPSNLTGLGQDLPMYGLVESTSPGLSYLGVNADLQFVLSALSDAFYNWKQE